MFCAPFRLGLALTVALTATACSDDASDSPTSPTPTPTAITESFTGTVTRNGAITRAFVANTGAITATLSTLSPENAIVGLALGEWNATTELCQIRLTNDSATQGKLLIGSAQVTSNYCIRVFDATGQLTGSVAFDVTLTHF